MPEPGVYHPPTIERLVELTNTRLDHLQADQKQLEAEALWVIGLKVDAYLLDPTDLEGRERLYRVITGP